MTVFINKLHRRAIVPARQTELSSGVDLHALDVVSPGNLDKPYEDAFTFYELEPGERVLVRTGLSLQMPSGMEAQVRPRSGLALKHGVTVGNSPGSVDADFRGDIGVILVNLGDEVFTIRKGDRIAQLVISTVDVTPLQEATETTATKRGANGFGSSGQA